MSNINKIFIPEKIKVGFINRSGTYTGTLSYIIYYDNKNILRKEASWNSWRDISIPPKDFDNIPIDGLVLNKSVGGSKSGWNYRRSYCRVFDPRGFEFEITIENLLWILEYCDCKDKVLSGKFVYSWEGTELVLLPVVSKEYKVCSEISKKLYNKSSYKLSDLIPGTLYKSKSLPFFSQNITGVFIGAVKVQKNFGSKFETKALFYNVESKDDIDKVYFLSPSSIEYPVKSNYIDSGKINDLLYRFNLTAFSWEFWNKDNIIKKFSVDTIYKLRSFDNVKNSDCKIRIDMINGVIDYYRYYTSLDKSRDYSYLYYKSGITISNNRYLYCKFKFENGGLRLSNIFTRLGCMDGDVRKYLDTPYYLRQISEDVLFDKLKLYPSSSSSDWDNMESLIKSSDKITPKMNQLKGDLLPAGYITTDDYYSESLQDLFNMNYGVEDRSITEYLKIIKLPIQLKNV